MSILLATVCFLNSLSVVCVTLSLLPHPHPQCLVSCSSSLDCFPIPRWLSGKESACQCRRHKRCGFNPWVGKVPWRRTWQPTPVFVPGESHGQRTLAGYSPWGRQESATTEHTCTKPCDLGHMRSHKGQSEPLTHRMIVLTGLPRWR